MSRAKTVRSSLRKNESISVKDRVVSKKTAGKNIRGLRSTSAKLEQPIKRNISAKLKWDR